MSARKASDLFVECLEAEGVKYVFGIPGEETLDLNESLHDSSISFVPVRHEQGGAYMADMYGRLTGRAGVCLGTLGPGATNLITAVADAFLDRSPLVALTGQADLERMHKESHQHIDIVSMFKPVVKWNTRLNAPAVIPEVVRKAFKVAQEPKPGPTHIELPEDVMGEPVDAEPLPTSTHTRRLEPSAGELLAAAEMIRDAASPVILAGNGVARAGAAPALRELARASGIGVAETFMGKGALDYADPRALGTVGLQSRDYALAGFDDADVVITVGYDLVEHAPSNWNPRRDKKIVCIDSVPSEVDEHFITEIDLVGDLYHILSRLTEELRARAAPDAELAAGRHRARPLRGGQGRRRVPAAAAARAVGDPPGARPPRHADLRRRAAQAVDRADVPGARAEHGADRERPGRDGDRAADGDRGQARASRTATWSRSTATAAS